MRVVELFAGVGGFRLGLERAGHQIVWANEWDKYAAQTYDKNFGGHIDRRDITTIPAEDIPPHDLICGGFPCQAFSIAGKRRGFDETRGTLFFDIARIAAHHKTKYLLLENVKNLLTHDGGHTFTTIIRTLDELGYDCQWQVLNSKNFGVPQNRERVIIVGHLRTEPRPQVFPFLEDAELAAIARGQTRPQAQISNALRAHTSGGRGDVEDSFIIQRPRGKNEGNLVAIAPTVQMGMSDGNITLMQGDAIRRLTPVECERLQSFPDGWTGGQADTRRYHQMGNAVTVNVIEAVARRLPMVEVP
jgi:DNA (cytosine-5)-methyltransferase 1